MANLTTNVETLKQQLVEWDAKLLDKDARIKALEDELFKAKNVHHGRKRTMDCIVGPMGIWWPRATTAKCVAQKILATRMMKLRTTTWVDCRKESLENDS